MTDQQAFGIAIAADPARVGRCSSPELLDSASGALILELLEELHRDGATIVVVTHDHELAGRLPRRVEMRDGRVVADVDLAGMAL